jgi:deoxyinosine 3'endonuclease (endonuclease V)
MDHNEPVEVRDLHPWPETTEEAEAIQDRLRPLLDLDDPGPQRISTAAGLDRACRHVLALSPRHRLPETTRLADRLCRRALREAC